MVNKRYYYKPLRLAESAAHGQCDPRLYTLFLSSRKESWPFDTLAVDWRAIHLVQRGGLTVQNVTARPGPDTTRKRDRHPASQRARHVLIHRATAYAAAVAR